MFYVTTSSPFTQFHPAFIFSVLKNHHFFLFFYNLEKCNTCEKNVSYKYVLYFADSLLVYLCVSEKHVIASSVLSGRECIIPDISRTFHFGASGLNVDSNFQELYFSSHALNQQTGNTFDVNKITKNAYEKELEEIIMQVF